MTVTVSSNSFTSGTQYSPNLVGAPGGQSAIARGQGRGREAEGRRLIWASVHRAFSKGVDSQSSAVTAVYNPFEWHPVLATVTPSPSRFTTRLLASLSAVARKVRNDRRFMGECSSYCMNHAL
jgi:hypothetical protein